MFATEIKTKLDAFAQSCYHKDWEAFIVEAIRTRYRPTLRYDVIGADAGLIARAYNDEMAVRGVDLRVRAELGMKKNLRRR